MIFGVPKWTQKGEFISLLGGHGAPWAPKSLLGPESCISRPPKVTPNNDNRLKKGAKVGPPFASFLARDAFAASTAARNKRKQLAASNSTSTDDRDGYNVANEAEQAQTEP